MTYTYESGTKKTIIWLEENRSKVRSIIEKRCKKAEHSTTYIFNEFKEYLRISVDDYNQPPNPLDIGIYTIEALNDFLRDKGYLTNPVRSHRTVKRY